MAVRSNDSTGKVPKASRPHMPGYGILPADKGKGLLAWEQAVKRFAAVRNYWLATTRPDGRPHVMQIWGLWWNSEFYFSTGAKSRKARNIAKNPQCVICADSERHAIIVEGEARKVPDEDPLTGLGRVYTKKYNWKFERGLGPIFAVRPRVAFEFIETADRPSEKDNFVSTATRWRFEV